MNIQFLHSWLLEHLDTKASPYTIAEKLSLCGPSVESVTKIGKDYLYDIEITTNRVDMSSIAGIAREAAVILPRFKIPAKLKQVELVSPKSTKKFPLKITTKQELTRRIMGVILTNPQNWESPNWMKQRLETAGMRSLNSLVDITNYVMLEFGHPTHVFDYDLIKNEKFIIRESKSGEKVTTFDGKKYTLAGGDIVIDNGKGEIIDVPGIIGTKNSVVNKNTKNILFFNETNNPVKIRRTTMTTGIRTVAASINEKGVDSELAEVALKRGIYLYEKITKAKIASKIFNTYYQPFKEKRVSVELSKIISILGVQLSKKTVDEILTKLGFTTSWKGDSLTASVPSWRADDINIPEDLIEEVARIYGYFDLPNNLMAGNLPLKIDSSKLDFEKRLRDILINLGGHEIYTLSLVPANNSQAIKIKNPLGADTAQLRTSLLPSISWAVRTNSTEENSFHLFEIANTYKPQKGNDLPKEELKVAGALVNYDLRQAKGILEKLLIKLNISYDINLENDKLIITSDKTKLGVFKKGDENNFYYYQFNVNKLQKHSHKYAAYQTEPKYPPQIEDVTIQIPPTAKVGDIATLINKTKLVSYTELVDTYKNRYTFRVYYQHPDKTLSDKEVEKIRKQIYKKLTQSGSKIS